MVSKAVFLLVGTIVGAGIFSLPYAFSQSGVIFSLWGLIALTAVTLTVNLFYLRIITATKQDHQLPGYGQRYLGKSGKVWGTAAVLLSSWGALLAYVILGGDFLSLLGGGGRVTWYSAVYWLAGSVCFWRGVRAIACWEKWLTLLLLILAVMLPLGGISFWQRENLVLVGHRPLAFYGPLLFALSGMGVIPEVEELLRSQRQLLPRVILWGSLLPALLYLIFAFGIWGISGKKTTPDALGGLQNWSFALVKLGAAVGFLATFTSFLSLTNVVKEVFFRDLGWLEKQAKVVAIALPLPAVFFSLDYFLPLISLTGALAIGGGGLLVLLIFGRHFARSRVEKLLVWLVGLILTGGVISKMMGW